MTRSIVLEGREIKYELLRKKVKRINLHIRADGSIWVSASNRVTVAEIERFMGKNTDFILKALDKFAAKGASAEPPQYETGDIVRLLGRDYELTVCEGGKNSVCLLDGRIRLTVRDTSDYEMKRKCLDGWLKKQCREVMEESCARLYPAFRKQGVAYPEIRIRTMKSRWGSCMPQKGVLTFNTNLIAAPRECVDYVTAHEFTHFLHPDHSKAFYESLAEMIPDWKQLRKETNEHPIIRKR